MSDDEATFLSPALPPGKFRYLSESLDDVQGWLVPSTALYLAGIEVAQRGLVEGGIAEIGVHRGKSFLAMTIDAPPDDPAVGVDLFDAQELNQDGTSVDALLDFRHSLERWGLTARTEVVEGSSLDLERDGFLERGRAFRLFSIDGGHGAAFVVNDLRIAERMLAPGGVVAADDVFNIYWLGVCTGTFEYFHTGGTLQPFALVPNKLLLTDAASTDSNKEMLRSLFPAGLTKRDVPLLDTTIDVYDDIDWTLQDASTGATAPLIRDRDTLDAVRARLHGVQLELSKASLEVRRLGNHKADLHRQLATANRRIRRLRKAASSAPSTDTSPPPPVTRWRDRVPPSVRSAVRSVVRARR